MNRKFSYFIFITILFLTFILLSASASSCTQRERIIKIGSQNVLTGDFKYYGQDQIISMNLAAKELAPVRIGGFDYKISILSRDDEGNAEKSFLVSQELIQEGAAGVIGSAFNATTKAAIPNYLEYNIPMITTSAPGTDLNKAGSNFFRIIINNDQIIENVSNFIITEIKPVNIVLIDDGKEYSINFNSYMKEILSSDIASEQIKSIKTYSLKPETEDYLLLAENILIDDVEMVFYCGDYSNLAKIIQNSRDVGVSSAFLTEKLSMDPGILQLTDQKYLEGLIAVVPQPPSIAMFSENPRAIEFWRKYKDFIPEVKNVEIEEPGEFAPYAYDAFYLLIEAMKMANSTLPEDYISSLRDISYEGITGKIEFDSNGNLKSPQSTVFIIKNGSWVRFQK
ncbi:MAG: branched-chain amino acid ABC transporter substrate-binding protein [Actinomycetota bacterium]|nr:branched-chain amino acid ABC transporter substrate-binding protein [Actinomycetota bacterium]